MSRCLAVSLSVGLGGLALAAALGGLLARDRLLPIAERALRGSAPLQAAFPDAAALVSYELIGFAWFAFLLFASGVVVWALAGRARWAGPLAVGLLGLDLLSLGAGFNTVADPGLLRFVPPSIQVLKDDPELFRIVTYGPEELLPANTGMLFGLQDARGYDTIIRRDYARYLEAIEPQTGLLYSKFDKLFREASLNSRLLDLLNVKYVLTAREVPWSHWRLRYDGEIRVYENTRVLPRAYVVGQAVAVDGLSEALQRVRDPGFDPTSVVVVDGALDQSGSSSPPDQTGAPAAMRPAHVVSYGLNRLAIEALPGPAEYLVLADLHEPGWTARVGGDERPLLRANGVFRAVALDASETTRRVEMAYSPISFRAGLVLSALGVLATLAVATAWAWSRLRPEGATSPLGRVLKNSLFPMGTSLLNKGLDLAFALLVFRVLGPAGQGAYAFVVTIAVFLDVLVNFGLGTLATRDVSRRPDRAGLYLGNTVVLRLGLWVVSMGLAALVIWPLAPVFGGLDDSVRWAVLLLTAAQLPSGIAGAASALFQARERFEVPAAVTVATSAVKIAFGVAALMLGWGFVGLTAVSLIGNVVTAIILWGLLVGLLGWPGWVLRMDRLGAMLREAYPLMLNQVLNIIFFRIDVLLLMSLAGETMLGWYSAAYKFVDGLQIIPASFVLALFPILSRQAAGDLARLARSFTLGLKVLLAIALPISVGTTLIAEPIIGLAAGPAYLPHSAIALAVLIWYLPLSFVNGITQYVLIAVGWQRWITVSFVMAAAFNLVANLLLIPLFGYLAAAAITVASEVVLLLPFWYAVRRHLPPVPLLAVAWRPALASAVMGVVVWWVREISPWLAIPAGAAVYFATLLALGTLTAEERRLLRSRGRAERAGV